jgi:uncharacterized protein YodC (DUF2158 family)
MILKTREMAEERFKAGDVVALKSSGKKMTVIFETEDHMLLCKWFLNGDVRKDKFSHESLMRCKDGG